ncbi:hypothetical protein Tco_0299334 [Tanacetum coccineum]
MSVPSNAKEKTNKKNDVKARGLLLMALPNEHQLIFSQYPDAKSMFDAIETQFKIVSRLAILGVVIAQEDLNLKFLSSLPPEWNTHVVVWMNKPEVDTMSIDDFTSSTDDVNTASPQVSSVSLNVNTTSPQVSTARLSDNTVNGFEVAALFAKYEGKEVLSEDRQKIFINANDTAEFPPPHPLIYNRPNKLDLSCSGLDEFKEPKFNGYDPRDTMLKSTIEYDNELENSKENTNDSLVKEQVSEEENSFVDSPLNVVKETVFHAAKRVEFVKPKNNEKLVRKSVRYTKMYSSQNPRGNQRNWNGQKSNQLGSNFVMYSKACFIYGSFNHVQTNCHHHQRKKMVTGNNYKKVVHDYYAKTSHPSTHRNMTPIAVLLKSGLTPLSTSIMFKLAQSSPNQAVNIVRAKGVNAVKTQDVGFGDLPNLMGKPQMNDNRLTFGGGAYGGRITDKGTLKTDNLNFDDVYFVNELKFNLFSVSHICDKKNYVLFTDIECLVLSPNFKLPDESQILLKIPRKDNMYSFDIKNIVPKESLTCLVAKATSDEQL